MILIILGGVKFPRAPLAAYITFVSLIHKGKELISSATLSLINVCNGANIRV